MSQPRWLYAFRSWTLTQLGIPNQGAHKGKWWEVYPVIVLFIAMFVLAASALVRFEI